MDNMKKIPLTQNKYCIIDDIDFDLISKYKWCFNNTGYAVRGQRRGNKTLIINMHRFIMNCPDNQEVDHINNDKLDNRRENLRICSRSENARNIKKPLHNTSGFKGVSWRSDRKRWRAYLTYNNKYIHLGHFITKKQAMIAYNTMALIYYGEFAKLN